MKSKSFDFGICHAHESYFMRTIIGDCVAMDQVLGHYDNQMNHLSICHIRSEEGYLIPMINMEVKDRLASRLIQGVTRLSVEKFESLQKSKFQYERSPNELA